MEPSELEDPTPYLLDGEFLLTAGLPFLAAQAAARTGVDAYVRRLVGAGVGPWASAWSPTSTPFRTPWWRPAGGTTYARRRSPSTVPFAAIGLEFSQLLESDNARLSGTWPTPTGS